MVLDRKQLEKLARLAKLEPSEADFKTLTKEIPAILDFVNTLEKAKTQNTPAVSQTTGLENVLREDDKIATSFTQEEALSQANKTHKGYFKTKAILKNED